MSECLKPRPCGVWSGVARPTCHFPLCTVLYPTPASFFAMVDMLRGMPAKPDTGSAGFHSVSASLPVFTCMQLRPVRTEEREGEQNRYA